MLDEVIVEFVLNEVDGAATEATAHNMGACNATLLSHGSQEVELLAAYLIVTRHTPMCLVHTLAHGLVVIALKGLAHINNALLLANDIAGTEVVLLGDLVLYSLKLLHCSATQELLTQECSHTLTRGSTVVIRRAYKLVLNARVDEH